MTEEEFTKLPMMMTVVDIQKALSIGRNSAYELVVQKNFPVLRLSERIIRIPKDGFIKWVKEHTGVYQIS
jgi:hypothetical protein